MLNIRALLALITAWLGMLLAIPVVVLALPFWVVAILTRAFFRCLEPRYVSWQQVIEFYSTIGWKPKPNLNTHGLADEVFHLTTDAEGWRGKATVTQSQIVVFGDSFAFGQGVSDQAFFSELNPNLCVKAIGSPGYNMVQELLWMRRLSPQLQGKLIVWLIYFGNDLYENLVPEMCSYRMPFVREVNGTGDWEIVTDHIRPVKWFYPAELRVARIDYYEKLAQLCSPNSLSERAYSACEFLVQQGRDLYSRMGTQLTIMTIPETTQLSPRGLEFLRSCVADPKTVDPDFPDEKLAGICNRLKIPLIALKDHLSLEHYKEHDPHWNEKGHERVAGLLFDLYREQFLTGKRNGIGT